jgi:outer membrane protease
MKSILKRIVFVSLLCGIFCPLNAQGQTRPWFAFSIGPQFGFLNGFTKEIIYRSTTTAARMSELDWGIPELFYLGAALDLNIPAKPVDGLLGGFGFFFNGNIKGSFSAKSGSMRDSDWLNAENLVQTNYSQHDNKRNEVLLADLRLGSSYTFGLPSEQSLAVKLFFQFSFMHYSITASNGWKQYATDGTDSNSDNFYDVGSPASSYTTGTKTPMSGTVVGYTQNWYLFSPGLELEYQCGDRFALSLSFNASPWTICIDTDNHYQRNENGAGTYLQFSDYPEGGLLIDFGWALNFKIFDRLEIKTKISYRSITDTRGDSYARYTNQALWSNNGPVAGADYKAIDVSLGLSYCF